MNDPGRIPLPDLGQGHYLGFQGGLYPNGSNARPPKTEVDAVTWGTSQIQPRSSTGALAADSGKIVMISLGMSNTYAEFERLRTAATADSAKNPKLIIVNGAQPNVPITGWLDPGAPAWDILDSRISAAGGHVNQVQVAWIKQSYNGPQKYGCATAPCPFSAHAQSFSDDLKTVARNLQTRYPFIKIAYLSSRTRANVLYPDNLLSPEHYAYESAFGVKWVIEDQIAGDMTLNYNPILGRVEAPLLVWGPYLWINGMVSRSDGATWPKTDLAADCVHPAQGGIVKVADQLTAFFKTDVSATPWFLRSTFSGNAPTIASSSANPSVGTAPLTVGFSVTARSNDSGVVLTKAYWTFEDGTYAMGQNVTKRFRAPGVYHVRVTVQSSDGDTVKATQVVTVK